MKPECRSRYEGMGAMDKETIDWLMEQREKGLLKVLYEKYVAEPRHEFKGTEYVEEIKRRYRK